jgi:hypothetical protein
MVPLMESKHFYYIAASYGWGVGCLAVFIFSLIHQRRKLRSFAQLVKGLQ